ncbi:unnamed protein product [Arctia plantaginis]|uniref:UDP-glucuronosyltransferase n=1 Tax=Arctia plantaginis TaxID=874455 RepID=A0A8S0ZKP3_ARCPL|nr:unnamed protein product [Arctia plantaginis]
MTMAASRIVVLCILFSFCFCDGFRILAVFPLTSASHGILGDNMVKYLIESGHEVTYITPFLRKVVHPSLHIVDVSENSKLFNENTMNVKLIMDNVVDFQNSDLMTSLLVNIASHTLENSNVQQLIQDPNQKFDVVIGEWMFSELYSVFAAIFECPLIWFSTIEPHYIILNMVDGPTNPAYTNDYQSKHVHPLSFIERGYELWKQISVLINKTYKFYYKEEEVYQRLIAPILKKRGRPVPPYEVLRYNASLVLGNTHVALGDAFAMPQNYKHIGGYHIDKITAPLPENLENLLSNAKHGVIYFSMGSNIKSKDMPIELKRGILKVFGNMKQTIIWKFEEVLSDVPENVHILRWAPQQSILAHVNTVLFITHGGLLSLTEAVHFAIPVIVIPVFADQFANALRVERKGYGKKLELSYTMYEDLKIAIKEILCNSKYSKKAKEISLAYHDRPMNPKEELNFWVNHVIRTQGAQHLRSPALELPLYKRLFLDLIAAILVSILILKTIICYIINLFSVKTKHEKEKRA